MKTEEFLKTYQANEQISKENLDNLILNGGNLKWLILLNCKIINCSFEDTDLCLGTFYSCSFENCNFRGCNLEKSRLDDVSFKNCNLEGINATKSNWEAITITSSNLSGSIFNRIVVTEGDFKSVDFSNSFFYGSELEAEFSDCNLTKVKFNGSNLEMVKFDFDSQMILADFTHCSSKLPHC